MPYITSVDEAKRLRDSLKNSALHELIDEWRMIRDRLNDEVLMAFAAVLPERVAKVFTPYQPDDVDDEVQSLKSLLASNKIIVEVISKANDPKVLKLAQEYEEALEGLRDELFNIESQMDDCDGIVGDGIKAYAIDVLAAGERLGEYADREKLREFADGDDDDEDEFSPRQQYRSAVRKHRDKGRDPEEAHELGYKDVTREAEMADGLRVRRRSIDIQVFDWLDDADGNVLVGAESGTMAVNPVLRDIEGYGVMRVENRLVLSRNGKPTEDPALVGDPSPDVQAFGYGVTLTNLDQVRYTQIRTLDQHLILIEGLPEAIKGEGSDGDGDGILVAFDSPFEGRTTGYYVMAGHTRSRAMRERRYRPVVLGMLIEAQLKSVLVSAMLAMAIAEAAREEGIEDAPDAERGRGLDATQESKTLKTTDGRVTPKIRGKWVLSPSRGLDLAALQEMTQGALDRYRKSKEFFSGTGSSSETGIHLARLQAAFQTFLLPLQAMRARRYKQTLVDISSLPLVDGRSIFVPRSPANARREGEGIRVSEPRELKPAMARLPVDVIVTIGAESRETQYAEQQMSRQEVEFGGRSMTTHMESNGTKDVVEELIRIGVDNTVFAALGTPQAPGWLPTSVTQAIQDAVQALVDQYMQPEAPPEDTLPPDGEMDEYGQPIDPMMMDPAMMDQPIGGGGAGFTPGLVAPPVQMQEGGVPVVSGAPMAMGQ